MSSRNSRDRADDADTVCPCHPPPPEPTRGRDRATDPRGGGRDHRHRGLRLALHAPGRREGQRVAVDRRPPLRHQGRAPGRAGRPGRRGRRTRSSSARRWSPATSPRRCVSLSATTRRPASSSCTCWARSTAFRPCPSCSTSAGAVTAGGCAGRSPRSSPVAAGAGKAQLEDLLVVATDVYTWKLLRIDRGLSARATGAAMTELCEAVVAR